MLRLAKVNKYYRVGTHSLHVLQDVDLDIADGEFVAIMGASGSGKSTLLNILGILDDYDSGEYYLGDTLIRGLSESRSAHYRNRFIGFVFQSFNLLPFKTALENVALPLYYQGITRRKRNQIAMQYLERGLERQQVERLEHEADEPVAVVRGAPLGQVADQRVAEPVVARVVIVEDAQDVEQGRLARPRRTHDRDELAVGDLELDVAQHVEAVSADAIVLVDLLEAQHC
ncbi:MAG TPA: ATP-binding cassette domain-containing protein [Kofleriaceae bacterium]|nr:ATP-binding cassette domain-containing protein [Kofleriaceae bacterium]